MVGRLCERRPMMAVNCVFCQVGVPERNTDLTKNIESPDILHNGHRYRHDPFLPEHRPAATGRIQFESQLGNIQAAAPMPITSPGNDDDTGENHQPTLRKNTAEPVEQTLKQNSVPRVTCPAHGVHAVPVPWARPGSGFTLLFEAMVVELAKSQPVADIAEQVGEHDTRLWRFIRHYVDEARLYEDYTGVEAIGIDETSRKGHRYITVVADLVERNVICVVPGKDSTTIKRFARDFMDHNGDPDRVRLVTCDMSLGFAKGIRERLPNAARIIDKFHVIKHANEAVDKVRKQEARGNALLKRTKYLWLRNESNLTGLQLETKRSLQRRRLKTGRACQMRETLQDIYDTSADRAEAETALKRLCSWMTRSRLEPMKEFARQIRRHWRDILAYFDHPYTNAILEGLNSVIQNVKTRARGFKNMGYFSTMIYLTCGKLDLSTVTT